MLIPRIRALAALTCSAALAATVVSTAVAGSAQAQSAPVSCRVGGVAASLPFRPSPRDPGNPTYDFSQFTASRNGTFAGIAYRSASSDFYLMTRAMGHNPVVLARVHYPYAHATPNSVTAVGYTPQMQLVVAIANTSYRPTGVAFGSYKGMYFVGGTGHFLAAGRWIAYMPTAVSDSGRIVGWAATGTPSNPHYYVVTWASVTANPVVLAGVGSLHPSVVITGNGDIAWRGTNGYTVVRLADGSMHELDLGSHSASTVVWPAGASKDSIYYPAGNGVIRWTVSGRVAPSTAFQGTRITAGTASSSWIDSVGARGDIIVGQRDPVYRLPDARWVRMPAQALSASAQTRVVSPEGIVAFTSAKDRLVHFMTCS